MLASVTVRAPAKVNLFLHVTGRRADGYHTLESLFALVDLADTITLVRRDDGAVVRTNDVAGVPADDDLAVRAARALQSAARQLKEVSAQRSWATVAEIGACPSTFPPSARSRVIACASPAGATG